MKIHLFLIFLFICQTAFGQQNSIVQVERYILFDKLDSAKIVLKSIEKTHYTQVLEKIVDNQATNSDLLMFCKHIRVLNTFDYENLDHLIKKNITIPKSSEINLDYVKLKQFHIQFQANELSLDEAIADNEKLKTYIEQYKNSGSQYKIANLYASIHDVVMLIIQKNSKEGLPLCNQNIDKSIALKDTLLLINFKQQKLDFLLYEKKLDEFIQNCREILELEGKLEEKTSMYGQTIDKLIDAYIYKGKIDEKYIEKLLFYRYQTAKLISYSYYAKFVGTLDKNSPILAKILTQFGAKNIPSLCDTMLKQTKGQLNKNEYYYVMMECSNALFYHKYYDQAFELKTQSNFLLKSVYAEELAQSIADFQTNKVKKEKETQIAFEKSKNSLYLIIVVSITFFLIILSILAYFLAKNLKIVKLRDAEKEMLIREVHHRVKNNFQTVSSLLSLQSKNISDSNTLEVLQEIQGRIQSMSLIHQKLYQKDNISTVLMQTYSEQLAKEVCMIYQLSNVQLEIFMQNFELDMDTAIPIGLILNELLTNSCKYVFPVQDQAKVTISLTEIEKGNYQLNYTDYGQGLTQETQISKNKTLGLRLIEKLAKQLQGRFEYTKTDLPFFTVYFKDSSTRKEID